MFNTDSFDKIIIFSYWISYVPNVKRVIENTVIELFFDLDYSNPICNAVAIIET